MPIKCIPGKKPHYKLTYFDARGIAETARILFHYAKVDFEDVRVTKEEWADLKGKPYNALPVLEVDGKALTESGAITRYLAEKFKLAGKNEWEKAKVNELLDIQRDFHKNVGPWFYAKAGFHEPEKADELYESLAKPAAAKLFPLLSERLRTHKGGFYVGGAATFVDFWIADYLHTLHGLAPDLFAQHQDLLQHVERVQHLPAVKAYFEARKPTAT